MSIHRLKKNLGRLGAITPNPSWQSARRDLLMQQVKAQMAPNPNIEAPSFFSKTTRYFKNIEAGLAGTFSALAARGVAVAVLAVFLLLGSGGYLVSAADNSLPNSRLYGIKIAVEEVRLKIARTPKDKIELEIEFASRRLDELSRLANSEGSSPHLSTLVARFEERISSASTAVANSSKDSPMDSTAMARLLDEKVASYEYSLTLTRTVVAKDISRRVDQAKATVSRAETEALKVIASDSTSPKEELAKKIDDKIKVAEETLKSVDARLAGGAKTETSQKAQDQSSAAKDNLAAAKQKVIEGDYKAAISILAGVEDIVESVSVITEENPASDGEVQGATDETKTEPTEPTPSPQPSTINLQPSTTNLSP